MACKIDGRMDGQLYVDILEDDLQASLEYYAKEPGDVIFQQDNDPKHTVTLKTVPMVGNPEEIDPSHR